ncbi:DUF3240 family protein [Bradyrhizobium barranii subsp. apii]|uniref:DUF3240 family protein n=1 Tax=Bradyrhizobium barranii subsp. apii TaxID=2819348 RepID=A0A8T5VTJ9_9BRAD|nr:DUF3240 family protein [Bradyrhizobium barranii]UPT89223.1 DUF3240 family protein [Bradyrhizobium barranii subsp. apii]UPT95022.1 DUF3240 family protein [Bradyrhizobium barranii subsp. apii]
MSAEFVCLTLIAGRSLRDELFDYLSVRPKNKLSDISEF